MRLFLFLAFVFVFSLSCFAGERDVLKFSGKWTASYGDAFFDFEAVPSVDCRPLLFSEECCLPFVSKQVGNLRLCLSGEKVRVYTQDWRLVVECRANAEKRAVVENERIGRLEFSFGPDLLICQNGILVFRSN